MTLKILADHTIDMGVHHRLYGAVVEESPGVQLLNFFASADNSARRQHLVLGLEMPWVYYYISARYSKPTNLAASPEVALASYATTSVHVIVCAPEPVTKPTDKLFYLPLPNQYGSGRACAGGIYPFPAGNTNAAITAAIGGFWAEVFAYHDSFHVGHQGLYEYCGVGRNYTGPAWFLTPYLEWSTWDQTKVLTLPWRRTRRANSRLGTLMAYHPGLRLILHDPPTEIPLAFGAQLV